MDPETPYVMTKSCEIVRPNQADVLPAGTQLVHPRTISSSSTLPSVRGLGQIGCAENILKD